MMIHDDWSLMIDRWCWLIDDDDDDDDGDDDDDECI